MPLYPSTVFAGAGAVAPACAAFTASAAAAALIPPDKLSAIEAGRTAGSSITGARVLRLWWRSIWPPRLWRRPGLPLGLLMPAARGLLCLEGLCLEGLSGGPLRCGGLAPCSRSGEEPPVHSDPDAPVPTLVPRRVFCTHPVVWERPCTWFRTEQAHDESGIRGTMI